MNLDLVPYTNHNTNKYIIQSAMGSNQKYKENTTELLRLLLFLRLDWWLLNPMGGQHLWQAIQVSRIWVTVPERQKEDCSTQIHGLHLILQLCWTFPLASLTLICLHIDSSCEGCSPRWPWPLSLCPSLWRWVPAWTLSLAWAAASLTSRSQEGKLQTPHL